MDKTDGLKGNALQMDTANGLKSNAAKGQRQKSTTSGLDDKYTSATLQGRATPEEHRLRARQQIYKCHFARTGDRYMCHLAGTGAKCKCHFAGDRHR
eukprot:1152625-Pelagomonas_calceolata.AAC.2